MSKNGYKLCVTFFGQTMMTLLSTVPTTSNRPTSGRVQWTLKAMHAGDLPGLFRGIGARRGWAAMVVEVIPARIRIVDDRKIGDDDPLPRPVEAEHRIGAHAASGSRRLVVRSGND